AFATAPAGTYGGQDEDVTLFGVKALYVTSSAMTDDEVYTIVTAILDNLDAFRAIHPALADLTTEDFLSGLGAPLHPGAERAYQEAGVLRGGARRPAPTASTTLMTVGPLTAWPGRGPAA